MTVKTVALAFTLTLAWALPGLSEELGRFTLIPAGEGFLRLDTESGAVSLCSRTSIGWACERLPDDSAPSPEVGNSADRPDKEMSGLHDRLAKAESDLAVANAANAKLSARAEAAEKAEQDAKVDAAERVARAEEAAKEAEAEMHSIQPHALEPVTPESAVNEFSEFLNKLMRRLQQIARDLQRDQSERAL